MVQPDTVLRWHRRAFAWHWTMKSRGLPGRRRVVHFGVTEHPTQEWTVLRDRDAIYGRDFAAMTRAMGMEEVLTAPRSPWQNPFAERLGGLHPTRVRGARYGME